MKKKILLKDSIPISLLYLNEFLGKDNIDKRKAIEFNEYINSQLENISISKINCFKKRIYKLVKEENMEYYILKENINIDEEWDNYIENIDQEILNISSTDELLYILGIINQIEDKSSQKGKVRKYGQIHIE